MKIENVYVFMKLSGIVRDTTIPLLVLGFVPANALGQQVVEPTRQVASGDRLTGIAYDSNGDLLVSNYAAFARVPRDFDTYAPYTFAGTLPAAVYDDLAVLGEHDVLPETDFLLTNSMSGNFVDTTFLFPDNSYGSSGFDNNYQFTAIAGSKNSVYGLTPTDTVVVFDQYSQVSDTVSIASTEFATLVNGSKGLGASSTEVEGNDLIYFAHGRDVYATTIDQLVLDDPKYVHLQFVNMSQIEDIAAQTVSGVEGDYVINMAAVGKDDGGIDTIAAYDLVTISLGLVSLDTDDDGISDEDEIAAGTDETDPMDPAVPGRDFDDDGLLDSDEQTHAWDPVDPLSPDKTVDTDGFGDPDYLEILAGTDPADPRDPWVDGDGDWVHAFDDSDDDDFHRPFSNPFAVTTELDDEGILFTLNHAPGVKLELLTSPDLQSWTRHLMDPITREPKTIQVGFIGLSNPARPARGETVYVRLEWSKW